MAELPENRQLVIFGAGIHSVPLLSRLEESGIAVSAFCDNDRVKWGGQYCGKPILAPEKLIAGKDVYYVLTGADCYSKEIEETLAAGGFPPEHIVSQRDSVSVNLVLPKETVGNGDGLKEFSFKKPKAHVSENPLVTIRMVLYKEPLFYAKRAIESILAQTFPDFRLVIIENGAANEMHDLVSFYASADQRIERVIMKENQIIYDTKYDTKYYCKIDGDDYYEPSFLERAVGAAELNNAEIVAVDSMWYEEGAPDRVRYTTSFGTENIVLRTPAEIADGTIKHLQMFASKWAKLMRTSLYYTKENTISDSIVEYLQDADAVVLIPDTLHYWTQRRKSFTHGSGFLRLRATNASLFSSWEKLCGFLTEMAKDCGVYDKYNAVIIKQDFLTHVRRTILPYLKARSAAYPEAAADLVDEMLKSDRLMKGLSGLAEYGQFHDELMALAKR